MTTTTTDGLTGFCRYAKDHPDYNPGLFHNECPGNQDVYVPSQRDTGPPAVQFRCSCTCHPKEPARRVTPTS